MPIFVEIISHIYKKSALENLVFQQPIAKKKLRVLLILWNNVFMQSIQRGEKISTSEISQEKSCLYMCVFVCIYIYISKSLIFRCDFSKENTFFIYFLTILAWIYNIHYISEDFSERVKGCAQGTKSNFQNVLIK